MAGDFVRAVLSLTEATAPAILAHFLAAVGTLIGPKVHVWAGGKQYARVNHVLVGPTTRGRKGTAYFLVDRLLELACKDFWRRQCVDGLSSGEGLIEYLADKQEWNDETKSYDIVAVEKRLCVVEQEFSRTLCVMEREGNTLSQILRSASDNGNLNSLTVKTRQAEGAHVTIVGHITPRELKDRLQDIQMVNGFGNRFLWWAVLSDKILPHTEPIADRVFDPFVPALQRLKEMGGSATEVAVRLDAAAQERWETLYRSLREDLPGRPQHRWQPRQAKGPQGPARCQPVRDAQGRLRGTARSRHQRGPPRSGPGGMGLLCRLGPAALPRPVQAPAG
jgi:hypothetical protein